MFSLILKNCGFHRTFRPFASQVRAFKRDVTPEDLNDNDFFNKFDKYKKGDLNGKDLYYPKYGASIYDDKIINEHKIFEKRDDRED
jgi:hypothetical protein